MPRPPRGRGDQLDAQRLEPQEDLGVHERAGMDGEDLHGRKALGKVRDVGQFVAPLVARKIVYAPAEVLLLSQVWADFDVVH